MRFLNRKVVASGLIVIGAMLAAASVYGIINSLTIPNSGNISMLSLYLDSECTQRVSAIDWGSDLAPDSVATKNFWIKNWGKQEVFVTMYATDWNPVNANDYMSLAWNREGDSLSGGMTLSVTLTLTIFANMTEASIGAWTSNTVFIGNE